MRNNNQNQISRRNFTKSLLGGGLGMALFPNLVFGSSKNKVLKVGAIGLEKEGIQKINLLLKADPNINVVAVADLFQSSIDQGLKELKSISQFNVLRKNQFVGINAYKRLCELKEIDIVLITGVPAFRSLYIETAVANNKHILVEAPIAIDISNLNRVVYAVQKGNDKKLSFGVLMDWRYNGTSKVIAKSIQRKEDFVSFHSDFLVSRTFKAPIKKGNTSTIKLQEALNNGNWEGINHLSGDHFMTEILPSVDKINWISQKTGDKIVSAYASGGIIGKSGKMINCFNQSSVNFIFESRKNATIHTSIMEGIGELKTQYIMTKKGVISDQDLFSNDSPLLQYKNFISSIRTKKIHSDIKWVESLMILGLLARAATYTGKKINFDQVLSSKELLFNPNDVNSLDYNLKINAPAWPGKTSII